ncbi:hypothetical protein [Candidatus Berkiella aquae]|uniref:Uncharacterized protein n=1 Tax=Candidatus Berkiella aquae TaxID=295108 RepID=A0A0Q9YYI4_9GAMM|nr:hypothetical protein [Candidatus Berkiella aquae]MCS5710546.1 hypothetical protein [Candidatus Berkiella aquae]
MALSGISLEDSSQFEQILRVVRTDKCQGAQLLLTLSQAQKIKLIQYLSHKVDQQCQEIAELQLLDADMDAQITVLEHRLAFYAAEAFNNKESATEAKPVKKKSRGCTLF